MVESAQRNLEAGTIQGTAEKLLLDNMSQRIFLSFCLYASFFSLGLCGNTMGTSLVHMVELYNTDLALMSICFTCEGFGYLFGGVFCGLFFDRFNHEVQFSISCLIMGTCIIFEPWLPHLYILYAVAILDGIAKGYIDAAGQSYIIKFWTGHRFKEPIMQGAHGIWSVAATIAPLIVKPFLVDIPHQYNHQTISSHMDANLTITHHVILSNDTSSNSTIDFVELEGLENVRYPFAIMGIFAWCVAFLFLIAVCRKITGNTENNEKDNKHRQNERTTSFKVTFLLLIFLFYVFYMWYEYIPGAFLAAFVIKGLEWKTVMGPLIVSVYWGTHGIGRLLGIPISIVMRPFTMCCCSITFTLAAFILMSIWAQSSAIVMWISTILAGLSMGSAFSSMVLYISEHMKVTGLIGGVITVGSSVGQMSGAFLAGWLFDTFTHMWVVYLSLIAAATETVLFILIYLLVRWKERDQHTPQIEDETIEFKPIET